MGKYKACDFFMVRTPSLALENYFALYDSIDMQDTKERLIEFASNPIFKEALFIASNDLWEAMKRTDLSHPSKSFNQVLSTLLKYSIRITTRPTPFGLFSGISMGMFGKDAGLNILPHSKSKKRARADMEWVYQVIKQFEANECLRNCLRVRFNDFIYHNGNRLEIPNKSFLQKDDNMNGEENATSIRYTKPVRYLEKNAKHFRLFSELVEEIAEENHQVTREKIIDFMRELLENEYLISELRPPLINTDTLLYLIHVLERNNTLEAYQYAIKLKNIQDSIDVYNATALGEGIEEYESVINQMKDIYVSKNYLQVDLTNQMILAELNEEQKNQLEDFVEAMYRLTPDDFISPEMNDFISIFSERYGYNAEVSLLEVLDVDQGIGVPANYGIDSASKAIRKQTKSEKAERLDILLKRKMVSTLRQNKNLIELTEEDIRYVEGNKSIQFLNHTMSTMQSIELYFLAHPSDIYSFTVAPAIGSSSVGCTFGRFDDLLTDRESRMIDEAIARQKDLLSNYVIAEIAEVPTNGRTSNVTNIHSRYDYQIVLNSNPCRNKKIISIQELYIGLDRRDNCFYIRTPDIDKRILVKTTNMLNPTFGSYAFRFLREISNVRKSNILYTIFRLTENKYDYSPRIVYRNIIIKPETWKISNEILGIKDYKQNFFDVFQEYRNKWKIPRLIFMTESDNRLMLDLDNIMHVNEIQNVLKKHEKEVSLVEVTCSPESYIVQDMKGNHYITEVVVPFMLNSTTDVKNSMLEWKYPINTNMEHNCMSIKQEDKMITPGQKNWLYYKLYGIKKRQNELLSNIATTLDNLKKFGLLEQYFFIRYSDPEYHFRVRIQATEGKLSNIFIKLNDFFEECRSNGMLSRVVIDTYQRESERYGGPQLIEMAEDYFYHDSHFAMELIIRQRYGLLDTDLKYITVSYVIAAAEAFGFSQVEQEKIFEAKANHSDYRKEFQKDRKMLIAAANSDNNWENIRSMIPNPDVYVLLDKTIAHMRIYARRVIELNWASTSSVEDILSSVTHMFCNRLMGDIVWEKKIYALTRHAFHALMERRRYRSI